MVRKGYVGEKKVQTFHKCFVWRELQVGAWDCVCGPASYLLTIAVEGDIWDKIGKTYMTYLKKYYFWQMVSTTFNWM